MPNRVTNNTESFINKNNNYYYYYYSSIYFFVQIFQDVTHLLVKMVERVLLKIRHLTTNVTVVCLLQAQTVRQTQVGQTCLLISIKLNQNPNIPPSPSPSRSSSSLSWPSRSSSSLSPSPSPSSVRRHFTSSRCTGILRLYGQSLSRLTRISVASTGTSRSPYKCNCKNNSKLSTDPRSLSQLCSEVKPGRTGAL